MYILCLINNLIEANKPEQTKQVGNIVIDK